MEPQCTSLKRNLPQQNARAPWRGETGGHSKLVLPPVWMGAHLAEMGGDSNEGSGFIIFFIEELLNKMLTYLQIPNTSYKTLQ